MDCINLTPDIMQTINSIRNNDIVRPLYKLLVIVKIGVCKTTELKFIFGGYYYTLIKEAQYKGFITQEYGRVRLTREGERIAGILLGCLTQIEKRDRKES